MLPRALLMFLLMTCAVACTPKFQRPNLTVVGIEMQGGNLLRQNFLVKFQVQNPNDRAIPVSGLHVDLDVGGQRVASGVSNRAFVVPPMGQSEFDMTVTANMAMALLQLANQRSDTVSYEVTGAADLDLPFMHDLPFHQTGSFSLDSVTH
ncbi:MAG TPA: LEA type 2 family protein [Steroidobacteraceae bacterium]|jgi:LEA14-like dessication related protein|nr:LEA type 2 family protein [Steroidobacteraceae bacterium]